MYKGEFRTAPSHFYLPREHCITGASYISGEGTNFVCQRGRPRNSSWFSYIKSILFRERGRGSSTRLYRYLMSNLRRQKNRVAVERCRHLQRLRLEALRREQASLREENEILRKESEKLRVDLARILDQVAALVNSEAVGSDSP